MTKIKLPAEPKAGICKQWFYVATYVICHKQYFGQIVNKSLRDFYRTDVILTNYIKTITATK